MFDADDFLNSSNETVLDDKVILIPPGEYTAQIPVSDESIKIKSGEKQDKEGNTKGWAQCTIRFNILDPSGDLEKTIFRTPGINYNFFLDLDENDKFDHSKQRNIKVGALLKAANKARPGWKFSDLKGQTFKISIAHVKSDFNPGEKKQEVVAVGVA